MENANNVIWSQKRELKTGLAFLLTLFFGFIGAAYVGIRHMFIVLLINVACFFSWFNYLSNNPTVFKLTLPFILLIAGAVYIIFPVKWYNRKINNARVAIAKSKQNNIPPSSETIRTIEYEGIWYIIKEIEMEVLGLHETGWKKTLDGALKFPTQGDAYKHMVNQKLSEVAILQNP